MQGRFNRPGTGRPEEEVGRRAAIPKKGDKHSSAGGTIPSLPAGRQRMGELLSTEVARGGTSVGYRAGRRET